MPKEGALVEEDVPLRNAMNEVLRDAYVDDCQRGVDRWNKRLVEAGVQGRLRLPSKRFYRHIGIYADMPFGIDGKPLSREDWGRRKGEWLPTDADREGYSVRRTTSGSTRAARQAGRMTAMKADAPITATTEP